METTSPLFWLLALLAGILTVCSPCILPLLPILVGRFTFAEGSPTLKSHRLAPLALVGGLIVSFALAGSLLGISASWFSGFANTLRGIAIAVLLGFGVLAIVPRWSYRFFGRWRVRSGQSPQGQGLAGEFWLGTQLGLLWTPCAGPVLGSILVLAAVQHQVMRSFIFLVIYGIGAGLPLLAIAYGSRSVGRLILKLRPYSERLQQVGGMMVVLSAIAILLGWDIKIQLWLAPLFPSLSF
uniref:Cytochrome c biogenesis protein transmembrane region n=1 Tax=Cyanothece sp. (strain PCC 7425 / ATCC 29141) TaxID=395961 RepID=B8HWQ5_CYAP4